MRASRLISVLLLLQTRGRLTAQQLADELEVSIRTVYRDVEELSASGIPVYADRGAHGGFQLVEGYRTRLTGLTPEEAETLFLSGYPGPAAELGLGTLLAAAQLKILAALPPELRSRATRIRQRFHLDAPGWFQEPELAPHLTTIAEAVWGDRRIAMRYRRNGESEAMERTVEPLGLVLKAAVWYMVARHGELHRTYRVSRIEGLELLVDKFDRPDDFDLVAYWTRSVVEYGRTFTPYEATIRVRGAGIERLSDVLGSGSAGHVVAAAGPPDQDGWLTLTMALDGPEWAEAQLLRLGSCAEVISPPELRSRMAATVMEMASIYHPG
jgi:predicted DNA-binding transcriptional regulator YafY